MSPDDGFIIILPHLIPEQFLRTVANREPLDILSTSLLTDPATSIRINPAKARIEDLPAIKEIAGEKVPWCQDGYYLTQRPRFTFDPSLHQGLYYVQDASSMSITAAIQSALERIDATGIKYLDLCAAPGGKTTAALSVLPQSALMVANEYDYKRAEILRENVAKWGCPNAVITRGDTSRFTSLPGYFHIVAVDAPCSGEGMMRKDEKAAEQWSESLVESCAELQREILVNAVTALAPGGCLIYSTCTFNLSENEDNVRWLIDEFGLEPLEITGLEASKENGIKPGIDADFPCYRFIPGHVQGEGQFMALLQKPRTAAAAKQAQKNAAKGCKGTASASFPAEWLKGEWKAWAKGDEIYGLPADIAADARLVIDKLDPISPGLHIATVKGRDLIPSQSLAMSTTLNSCAFPLVEVDRTQAIAYLQRQAPELPVEAPRGIVLLTHGGHPLGFAKNLGNRANNLYPRDWRILSQE